MCTFHTFQWNAWFERTVIRYVNSLVGVCIDTYVFYQSVLEKRPMNRKFDQCVSQKRRNVVTSCHRDIVTSDTSGLHDHPFNLTKVTYKLTNSTDSAEICWVSLVRPFFIEKWTFETYLINLVQMCLFQVAWLVWYDLPLQKEQVAEHLPTNPSSINLHCC